MWKTKEFKTRTAMQAFLAKWNGRIQWVEVFVNNSFCIEYRRLRQIY